MSAKTRAYLMTRGTWRRLDYDFLFEAPPEQWWGPLERWVNLQKPEIALRSHGRETGLIVSGIPSQRRDVIGTPVRHTVVVDNVHEAPELARWLVHCGLDEAQRETLGRRLDATFDEDAVNACLTAAQDGNQQALATFTDLGDRLLDTLRTAVLGPSGDQLPIVREADRPGSWVGPVEDHETRMAFHARVENLLSGTKPHGGFAFTTHSLSTINGASQADEALSEPVAVLLHDSALQGVTALGKATAPVPAGGIPLTHSTKSRKERITTLYIVTALLGLALVLGGWVLLRYL
ncbi:hypothetical protein ACWGDT_00130 [Streptomyces avermitilis]